MKTYQQAVAETAPRPGVCRCPKCDGVLSLMERSWGCANCRHVPRHGAD